MIKVRKSVGIAAALALALTLSACSSSSTPATDTPTDAMSAMSSAPAGPSSAAPSSVGTANVAFCNSSAALNLELANLKALVEGGSVTAEALETQEQALSAAGDQVKTDAQALAPAVQAEFAAAQAAYQSAVGAIPADQTGTAEVAAYVAAATAFGTALEGIDSEVGCAA